jgi:amidase
MTEAMWLDATAQADLVRRGEVSAADLVEVAIDRIEGVNPTLDAVIRTRFERARAEAAGELPDGPFRGVPIPFKDLGCTIAGEVTAFGVGPLRDQLWPVTSYRWPSDRRSACRRLRSGGRADRGGQPARGGRAVGAAASAGARVGALWPS